MTPGIHVFCIVATATLTIHACVFLWRRPTNLQYFLAPLIALLAFLIGSWTILCCPLGQPFWQKWIPASSFVAFWCCVGHRVWRGGLMVGSLVAQFLLVGQFGTLTHGGHFTGNVEFGTEWNEEREERLREIQAQLKDRFDSERQAYPAGWLAEAQFIREDPKLAERRWRDHRYDPAYRVWHTWLTGLFAQEEHRVELWYPGGAPGDAVDRIEWRDR